MTPGSSHNPSDAATTLALISDQISECRICPLAESRTNTVPGEGSYTAEIMFIGEGPGGDEDKTGRPFVGRAGKILDELIDSIPMRREDVFIANVIKCRPPGNRDPEKTEIESCSPYIKQQIETIDPLVIVTLGRFALNWFFPDLRITANHGKILGYDNRALLPLYHPASGLRNPEYLKRIRQDIHKIPEAMATAIRNRLAPEPEVDAVPQPDAATDHETLEPTPSQDVSQPDQDQISLL